MKRATPDWLLELSNERGAGVDAIALFRGAEPSVIVEAIIAHWVCNVYTSERFDSGEAGLRLRLRCGEGDAADTMTRSPNPHICCA